MEFLNNLTKTVTNIIPGASNNKKVVIAAENNKGDVAVLATNVPATTQAGGMGYMRKNTRRGYMRKNTRRTNMRKNTRRTNSRRA